MRHAVLHAGWSATQRSCVIGAKRCLAVTRAIPMRVDNRKRRGADQCSSAGNSRRDARDSSDPFQGQLESNERQMPAIRGGVLASATNFPGASTSVAPFTFPLTCRHGTEAPVNEHAEACLAPPCHSPVFRLLALDPLAALVEAALVFRLMACANLLFTTSNPGHGALDQ